MMHWFALAVIALQPPDVVPETRVEIIELNHVINEDGTNRFSQFIGWDQLPDGSYVVVDWKLATHGCMYRPKPARVLILGEYGSYRIVGSVSRESWTFDDPEMEHRAIVPEGLRRKFYRPRGIVK